MMLLTEDVDKLLFEILTSDSNRFEPNEPVLYTVNLLFDILRFLIFGHPEKLVIGPPNSLEYRYKFFKFAQFNAGNVFSELLTNAFPEKSIICMLLREIFGIFPEKLELLKYKNRRELFSWNVGMFPLNDVVLIYSLNRFAFLEKSGNWPEIALLL
jgi:hypothetical protein